MSHPGRDSGLRLEEAPLPGSAAVSGVFELVEAPQQLLQPPLGLPLALLGLQPALSYFPERLQGGLGSRTPMRRLSPTTWSSGSGTGMRAASRPSGWKSRGSSQYWFPSSL